MLLLVSVSTAPAGLHMTRFNLEGFCPTERSSFRLFNGCGSVVTDRYTNLACFDDPHVCMQDDIDGEQREQEQEQRWQDQQVSASFECTDTHAFACR